MTRVKICGITNRRDAEDAARYGADAIGFVFADSPRKIAPSEAKKIIKAVGPWVASVGVFVNEPVKNIVRIASECRLSAVQLHGDESVSAVKKLSGCKVIKAFRVDGSFDFSSINGYDTDAFLFDTRAAGKFGGTGKTFDWRLIKPKKISRPFIVSGGLDPLNVEKVVALLSPYGVDASGGLERSPGKKDPKLVKAFIQNAKKK